VDRRRDGRGIAVGASRSDLNSFLDHFEVEGISLPIALGLLVMMYPVLAKVRYDRLDTITGDRKLLASSLVLNWLLGPALMVCAGVAATCPTYRPTAPD